MAVCPVIICVANDVLPDPVQYRAHALTVPFGDWTVGGATFHGIAEVTASPLFAVLSERFGLVPTASAFRRSPEGQHEPTFVHHDADMGDWTAILYLNPAPWAGDGTDFYRHVPSGATAYEATQPEPDWADPAQWQGWRHVAAVFNRLVLFTASAFHSRALVANYGQGAEARLIQVTFGTGAGPSWAQPRPPRSS